MIETGLVYVHAIAPAKRFVGCGALIEGGYVATCRHVWRMATQDGAAAPAEVEIAFPRARPGGVAHRESAHLAGDCLGLDDLPPDLVLLRPAGIPAGMMTLPLASHDRFEAGPGYAIAGLVGRDAGRPDGVRDAKVKGEIADFCDADGRRQFTGDNPKAYWTDRGSSGSPVFREGGEQLAGILSLSETGARAAPGTPHEAFVVPGTTIRRHLASLKARQTPGAGSIDPAELRRILARIGAEDVPIAEIPARIARFVEDALARAAEPPPPSNDGADIAAVIAASRAKLGELDATGARDLLQAKIAEEAQARDLLQAKIAEEAQARARRMLPLLKERAAVERISFDHESAKATLTEITALDRDDIWSWIELGDLWQLTGPLDNALAAYAHAEEAARRTGAEHDQGASHDRIGNVKWAQGDLQAALDAYTAALGIAESLARRDPGNTEWQRDLSVSHIKTGDVKRAQGDLQAELDAYTAALGIAEILARRDPANTVWQRDLSVSHERIGDVKQAQGDLQGALDAYTAGLDIRETLGRRDPANTLWQRDLSVSHNKIGNVKRAQGDLQAALDAYTAGLGIRETLARRDPGNTEWQRDLSVSHEKIGDVKQAQGDLQAALDAYTAGLGICETLARRDPANTVWQRDLSVSHEKIGDVRQAQGDLQGALDAYTAGLGIRETLACRDPGNTAWQRDLVVSCVKVAECAPAEARGLLERALGVVRTLEETGRLAPVDGWMPEEVARRLAVLPDGASGR